MVTSHPAILSGVASTDFTTNAFNPTEARRTRKRINTTQLAYLEELYRQSSHPTRVQRDTLAKRIHMETKSVTIWFQNKRQTDRKVALHNATNSRNVVSPRSNSKYPPNITLMVPTSPLYPLGAPNQKVTCDGLPRRQCPTRPAHLKRAVSLMSSTSTTSTTSTSRSRPSLDRVASRTEIRFTDHHKPTPNSGGIKANRTSSLPLATASCDPPPVRTTTDGTSRASPPASPSPTSLRPLWETMLSSPLMPSSPPDPEYITYARAHKTRTLDWACAAARLTASDPAPVSRSGTVSSSSLLELPLFEAEMHEHSVHASKDEEVISVTEDEAELVTPYGSQDASAPWLGLGNPGMKSPRSLANGIDVMGAEDMDKADLGSNGWEEDEMHAALALCGLRG